MLDFPCKRSSRSDCFDKSNEMQAILSCLSPDLYDSVDITSRTVLDKTQSEQRVCSRGMEADWEDVKETKKLGLKQQIPSWSLSVLSVPLQGTAAHTAFIEKLSVTRF